MVARRGLTAGIVLTAALALSGACKPAEPAAQSAPASVQPAATAPAAAPAPSQPTAPPQVETLRGGVLASTTDAGIFIAQDLGYFREQGIELDLSTFDSAARMVAPLGAGQLDIGAGAHSAGLNNAISRGVDIKLVADKGSATPGHGFQALVFRKELVDSGQLRSPADLRGRRVAVSARGITVEVALATWLRRAGLSMDDVEPVEMGFPDQVNAIGNGSLDATISIEPFLTRIVDLNVGTIYQRTDELIPGYQVAEVFYAGQFMREQPDVARRFMVAYLKGVRYYNDAFDKGDAAKRQETINILTRNTTVKDAALYDRMVMPGLAPDGHLNVASISEDQDYFLAAGLQQQRIDINTLIDHSFADAAVQALGPYQ
ncbi:MAG TPA: ABC transporter substrate-binding protein [Chloroflexota bacterium]|nr:ABC transporter substrate-binding protein [Chloroflexota bacterium]